MSVLMLLSATLGMIRHACSLLYNLLSYVTLVCFTIARCSTTDIFTEAARTAIAQRYGSTRAPLTPDDVIITSGCSGAIDIAVRGLVNPGDNILLPKPGFPFYEALCQSNRIEYRFYNLKVRVIRAR